MSSIGRDFAVLLRAAEEGARREQARVEELYVEEAEHARAWLEADGRVACLARRDAGASVFVARGRPEAAVVSFGASAGLERGDVATLARRTAQLARAARPPSPRPRIGSPGELAGLLEQAAGKQRGGVRVTASLFSLDRKFEVGSRASGHRPGRERALQVEARAQGERGHRRASIDVRIALELDAPASWSEAVRRAADEAARCATLALRAKSAPRGPTTVVLGPGSGAALFHEVVGHPLEADFVAQRRSWFRSEHVGRKLACEELTIADDPRFAGSPVRYATDDQGARARRVVLIEAGEWAGLLHDRTTAALSGVAPCGHGRRSSWRAQARPRMSTTVVSKGPHAPGALLGSVRRGVYVARIGFGRADFVTGRFSMAASEAYEIRAGKLGAPLADVHLEGDALSFLASVRAVGNDLAVEPGALLCDKDDEVRVGLAQPTVLLEGVRVA